MLVNKNWGCRAPHDMVGDEERCFRPVRKCKSMSFNCIMDGNYIANQLNYCKIRLTSQS